MAVAALIWPSRLSGMLDGAPLDTLPEVLLLGLIAPALACLHPVFLHRFAVRAVVVAILAMKIGAALVLQQQGWCVAFTPAKPMVRESTGKPHSWDIRADWLADDPTCSAVMTRSFRDTFALPVWFFNLPPPDDAPHRGGYGAGEIPVRVDVFGFIDVGAEGALDIVSGPGMDASLRVDGARVDAREPGHHHVALSPGTHGIQIEAMLATKHWPIVPAWNGHAMESMFFPETTIKPPSRFDRMARPIGNWLLLVLCGGLVLCWLASFALRLRDLGLLIWSTAAAAAVSTAALLIPTEAAAYTAAVLTVSLLIITRQRFHNARGAFLLIGVPWLAYFAAANLHQVGRWTLYGVGNDNFLFQRYSYRVFMQHFWLEGGQVTFWNQPFYRWIAGALHMLFGDSSLGQVYWDAAGIVIMATFAFTVVAVRSTFSAGLIAAIISMAMFLLGPTLEFVGFGLSEIASASFIYLAALVAMRNRGPADVVIAGVLVILGFYTRLNNLPMAAAVAACALPVTFPAGDLWRPRRWWPLVQWRVVIGIGGGLAIGAALFAWRTWYYTGVFGVFHGTQREFLAVWKPGMSAMEAVPAMTSSLMMVLTASDPPQLAWHALPLLTGAFIAVAAVCAVPGFRDAPLPVVALFLAGCVGALVTRGWGHEGRFSIHLFGAAAALCGWALSSMTRALVRSKQVSYSPARPLET
jgi:hypothetical protein